MRVQLIVIAAILCMSFAVGATDYSVAIQGGSNQYGAFDFSDVDPDLVLGTLEFVGAQWGLVDTFDLAITIEALSDEEVDLGEGLAAYTKFLSFDITNGGTPVTFDHALLTLGVGTSISDYVNDGLMYYSDDGGATWSSQAANVLTLGNIKVMQATITQFSIWGGGGDDPTIPDPSIASIIGCGLLMLSRKFKAC